VSLWSAIHRWLAPDLRDDRQVMRELIVKTSTKKLGRPLTAKEHHFVHSRRSGIALEMICDTVEAADEEELVRYLNSE
jgi:hypothetical protein